MTGASEAESRSARMGRDGHTKLPSWRWEALRTTLWLVPTLSVVVSCLLFAVTFEIDLPPTTTR